MGGVPSRRVRHRPGPLRHPRRRAARLSPGLRPRGRRRRAGRLRARLAGDQADLLAGHRAAGRRRLRGHRARPPRLRRQRVGPDGFHDVPAHSHDLYALVHDQLGHERVVLVGGDLGGPVIQDLALRHPEWVERMVLFNSPLPYDKERMAGHADPPRPRGQRLLRPPGHRRRRRWPPSSPRPSSAVATSPPSTRAGSGPTRARSRSGEPPGASAAARSSTSTPSRSPTAPSSGPASAATRASSTRRRGASRRCSARNDRTPTLHPVRAVATTCIYPDFDRMAAVVFARHVGPFLLRDCGHFVPWEAPHTLVSGAQLMAADLLAARRSSPVSRG